MERISNEMKARGAAHLFIVFDQEAIDYNAFLTKEEASHVIEYLTRTFGGEALDQAVDRIIEKGEWPETIS